MTFGPVKITASEAVASILVVIKDELMKQECFSNQSLAYYGIELDYKLSLTLHARKESHVEVEKESPVIGMKSDPDPQEVKIKGKRVAGKKLLVEPGKHTRHREGTAV